MAVVLNQTCGLSLFVVMQIISGALQSLSFFNFTFSHCWFIRLCLKTKKNCVYLHGFFFIFWTIIRRIIFLRAGVYLIDLMSTFILLLLKIDLKNLSCFEKAQSVVVDMLAVVLGYTCTYHFLHLLVSA